MALEDNRGRRFWLKVQLRALDTDEETRRVRRIVEVWREGRVLTSKLLRAVIVYSALEQGDVTELLRDFPHLAQGFGPQQAAPPRGPMPKHGAEVVEVEKPVDEAIDDFMDSLGF